MMLGTACLLFVFGVEGRRVGCRRDEKNPPGGFCKSDYCSSPVTSVMTTDRKPLQSALLENSFVCDNAAGNTLHV